MPMQAYTALISLTTKIQANHYIYSTGIMNIRIKGSQHLLALHHQQEAAIKTKSERSMGMCKGWQNATELCSPTSKD